ncbi:MAG: hypothetical protein WD048_07445 [Chitinophagales bacterium]
MKISAPHIANLFHYAAHLGYEDAELRQFLENPNQDIRDVSGKINSSEFVNALGLLSANTKYAGLYFGCSLNYKTLGFVTQLQLNSYSFEQAVFILQNYLQNAFPIVFLEASVKNKNYTVSLKSNIEDEKLRLQVLDMVFCFIYREFKLILSTKYFPKLILPYSNLSEYRQMLKIDLASGQEHLFVFDAKVMEAELNQGKIKAIEVLLPKFMDLIGFHKSAYPTFSAKVRSMILNMSTPELPDFSQVSKAMLMSERTVQRKLSMEGQSYRKIKNDIKKELYQYLSKARQIKVRELAMLLGYSDSSALLHAVKEWKRP